MKDVEFVIAKYKEDLSWIDILEPYRFRIYNKDDGGDLPNIGREAHTYLHHIIENYDKLADVTVFLQGNPLDHTSHPHPNYRLITDKDELKKLIESHPFDITEPFFSGHIFTTSDAIIPCQNLFGQKVDYIRFTAGALWIVQKADILNRPRIFYELLQKEVIQHENITIDERHLSINPWSLERLWQFIFNSNIPIHPSFYTQYM